MRLQCLLVISSSVVSPFVIVMKLIFLPVLCIKIEYSYPYCLSILFFIHISFCLHCNIAFVNTFYCLLSATQLNVTINKSPRKCLCLIFVSFTASLLLFLLFDYFSSFCLCALWRPSTHLCLFMRCSANMSHVTFF